MRQINTIIIHHTASKRDVSFEAIRRYHVEQKGWSDIGYHYFIDGEGVIHHGRPVQKIGVHAKGYNDESIGIAVAGDNTMPGRQWVMEQMISLAKVIEALLLVFPEAVIGGHRDFTNTLCPGFDFQKVVHDNA